MGCVFSTFLLSWRFLYIIIKPSLLDGGSAHRQVGKETSTGIKFDLKAANGEIIATSEGYKTKASCENGIESVKNNAPEAPVEE